MPTRMRRTSALLALTAGVLLAAACKGPQLPDPRVGQTFYLCCNMHYDKPEITDVNYQQGALIPFGTRVQILRVFKSQVEFQPEGGHPAITLVEKYGRKTLPFDTYLSRIFVTEDPHLRLKRAPKKRLEAIQQGNVDPGMSREDVLMALGYPPAHRTPSLESIEWHYWQNRWQEFVVWFDGDKVARVQR